MQSPVRPLQPNDRQAKIISEILDFRHRLCILAAAMPPDPIITFSLLQLSLDQTIGRRAFEDASIAVESISRADCAMLYRDLYGIVVSNLSMAEALAFQTELAQRNFPTTIVPDSELPLLDESFQIHDIVLQEENLVLTDSMGHLRIRPVSDLVFLAAGYVSRLHFKSEWHQHLESGIDSRGATRLVTELEHHEESEIEFRLDFFFGTAPERQHAALGKDSIMTFQGTPLLLRDLNALTGMTSAMASLLPQERVNTFLRDSNNHPPYLTFHAYKEEIRWYFHGLRHPA
jgi:hypothetical protein